MGRVARIEGDGVLILEIAQNVRVKVRHAMISELVSKPEPRSPSETKDDKDDNSGNG